MNSQKGNTGLIVGLIGFAVVAGLGYFMFTGSMSKSQTSEKDKMMVVDTNKELQKQNEKMGKSIYSGKILAGTTSPYLDFNKADYERALSEGKIIFLDFYANWCPICRGEAPIIEGGFNGLTNENIVGFRVNYNDSETDDSEKALAEKFDITYQHTKVILKDGNEVLKDGNVWDSKTFIEQLNSVL